MQYTVVKGGMKPKSPMVGTGRIIGILSARAILYGLLTTLVLGNLS
jgi:hypothetical protein